MGWVRNIGDGMERHKGREVEKQGRRKCLNLMERGRGMMVEQVNRRGSDKNMVKREEADDMSGIKE
jgi:hypothetical protein